MGREKSRKSKRERPTYVQVDVDGEPATVALPQPLLEVPRRTMPDVIAVVREMRRRGHDPRQVVPGRRVITTGR
jgi:hypothetical protein